MPFTKCPICGAPCHLNVTDPKEWYREHAPHLPFGSLVPGRCFHCFVDLNENDRVVVRALFGDNKDRDIRAGDQGLLQAVLSTQEGTLYKVRLDSGVEATFIRAELRKQRSNE
jgi:hypothetical protein